MNSICIFCGSNKGFDPAYAAAAVEIGQTFAKRKIRTVYGAGNVGLMGILADAALENGGKVLGVIPDFLKKKRSLPHRLDRADSDPNHARAQANHGQPI